MIIDIIECYTYYILLIIIKGTNIVSFSNTLQVQEFQILERGFRNWGDRGEF